ncbi:MAG: hypothetical protein QG639_484 [Patescibacteria group bacterium]|nr:hypothetical protein [Patescibacteria group bacterium]
MNQQLDQNQKNLKLIFCSNKVYFPTMVLGSEKQYLMMDPVHIENIDETDIVHRIEIERKTQAGVLTKDQTAELLKISNDQVVLSATGFSNTAELNSRSATYSILWDSTQKKVVLFLNDPDSTKFSEKLEFDYEVDVVILVTTILRDLKKYPKVFIEEGSSHTTIPNSSTSVFSEAIKKNNNTHEQRSTSRVTVTTVPRKHEQTIKSTNVWIVIKNGQAFIATNAETSDHVIFGIDPIYISKLIADELLTIVSKVINQENRTLSLEEAKSQIELGKKGKSPILLATKSTSWLDLERSSVGYSIQTYDGGTKWVLFLHSSKKGVYKDTYFQITTPLRELVELILEDVKKYPSVLGKYNF